MKYQLCLFDLDGTLLDPQVGITKSLDYALSAFGIHEKPDDLTKFIGPPLRETFRDYYRFSDADTEKAVIKFREYFAQTGLFENVLYPGIIETLTKLKEHGIILAVATSKVTVYSKQILEHFALSDFFDFVSGDEMDGSLTRNGKKKIISIALDTLDPKREMAAVMIGDRKHDLLGAEGNRIDSIGITWGYGSREELETHGATAIVDSTAELFRLITG
ncbi:MAG: HAD hydrolase-like protein [Lachnospiraceae bacterium]|jgi:phosphoglycolate phosphatase|nr:HAD hydrolase-like protein [Lachnospiraceae bacterium]